MLKRPAPPRQRGYSLIEVVVALAVLVLVMFTAIPGFRAWIVNTKVRTVAELLQTGLNAARTEALRRNTQVSFWLVSAPASGVLDGSCTLLSTSPYWVVSVNTPQGQCDAAVSATQAPFIAQKPPVVSGLDDATVAALAADGSTQATSVTFNAYGQLVSNGAAIRSIDVSSSQNGARRLRLAIGAGGSVRLCDRDVASADPRSC